ncbi:hypothetical protein [Mycetocola zhadangensis]|uniref:Uncharacterized protein n=1 Tax=Mycetocola zhadangensis TaxID=1164595 RepID=A0A3L7J450_9MICO|nr:hypothetical protein [Mycetocola zhadangensis]RLQ84211.1 hypothetical protein D9V28_08310 [Mycetocola zhadangensis]GGE95142.1 hypothetical protein GCM10011313_17620 [Mycetocola zhadangensis]
MPTFKARLQVCVSLAVIATAALTGCASGDVAAKEPKGTAQSETPRPSNTAEAETDVDRLPLLEGTALPAGWTTATCAGLSAPVPPGWLHSVDGEDTTVYSNDSPSAVPAKPGYNGLAQVVGFNCSGEKSDWDGSWSVQEGTESWRVEVPGAKFAAAFSQVVPAAEDGADPVPATAPGDEIVSGEFQILSEDDVYYNIYFVLPVGDPNNEILLQAIAGNLAVAP